MLSAKKIPAMALLALGGLSFMASWSVLADDQRRPPPVRDKDVPDCGQFATSRTRVMYPRDELRRGTEGWVALSYKLAGDGSATDIRLFDSERKDVFVQAAASAFQQCVSRGQ